MRTKSVVIRRDESYLQLLMVPKSELFWTYFFFFFFSFFFSIFLFSFFFFFFFFFFFLQFFCLGSVVNIRTNFVGGFSAAGPAQVSLADDCQTKIIVKCGYSQSTRCIGKENIQEFRTFRILSFGVVWVMQCQFLYPPVFSFAYASKL